MKESLQREVAQRGAEPTTPLESAAMERVEALHAAREQLVSTAKMLEEFAKRSRVAANSLAEIADLLGAVTEEEDERAEFLHLMDLHSGNMLHVAKELAVSPAQARRTAERLGVAIGGTRWRGW